MDEILKQVNVDNAWDLVEVYSKMARWKPDDVNNSCDEITNRLDKFGVEYKVYNPELYLSIPYTASVKLSSGDTLHAKPPAYSINCEEGITAKLHYVPAHFKKDIENLFDKSQDKEASTPDKVRGKIIISEGFAFPGKIQDFEKAGAVGVIAVNPGVDIHWGICTSIWGMPEYDNLDNKPNIPVVAVNLDDGKKLIELSKNNEEATLFTKLEEGWFNQKIPEVTIKSDNNIKDFILLHGHYDSWDVGVGDNATGDATMLEIARLLQENKSKLNRSVKIVWWPGHSTGRYAGSTWYADNFGIELSNNCVAQINCDSPGCRWADTFDHLSVMTEAEDYVHKIIKGVANITPVCERPHRAGDYSFNNIGISSFFMLSSTMTPELRKEKGYYAVGGCGGNIAWHTENDILEIADKKNLERDIKVYAASIIELSTCKYLPFNWQASANEFEKVLNNYQKNCGDNFDLSEAISAADDFKNKIKSFYEKINNDSLDPDKANAIIMRLARILVPLNYARNPRFSHDPAVPIPQLPVLSLCDEFAEAPKDKYGFIKNQLVRGRNRVVDALNEAGNILE